VTEQPEASAPAEQPVCCVCGGGPVTYRNYRDLPFCWPCADCQCAQNPCVRTGVNDPAVSTEISEPSDKAKCSGEEGFCPEHGFHRHSLKQPTAGYCPHCGRGDAGPDPEALEPPAGYVDPNPTIPSIDATA
jgi:hypothetical protein